MSKINDFLNSKIVKTDVGEETYLTWKETISYAVGRGAQGMNTSMTSSKYINYFLTNVLFKKLGTRAMSTASTIRTFCGIFDAINDPIMGVIVDKTRTKEGQMHRLFLTLFIQPFFLSGLMLHILPLTFLWVHLLFQ